MKFLQLPLATIAAIALAVASMACGGTEDDASEASAQALCSNCGTGRPLCIEQKRLFDLAVKNQDTPGIISADNRYTQAGCGPSLLAAE